MKKTLLCAALVAAGIATSVAQNVYSLNVVGYYNITVPASGYALIANQLNTTNNTIGSLLPSVPPNTIFYKYAGSYSAYVFDEFDLIWTPDGNATLNPGEGGFIKNPDATPLTLTFVGEVMQGSLTNPVPAGYAIRSSMVPQAGGVSSVLGFPAAPNDIVYKYAGAYSAFVFDEFDLVWTPSEPAVSVGEAFFSFKGAAVDWVRNFTVN